MKFANIVHRAAFCSILSGILFNFAACKKFVEIKHPEDQVLTAQVFSNDKTALSAIHGLYSQLSFGQNFANGSLSIFGGLSADELKNMVSSNSYPQFWKNAILPSETTVNYNRIWKIAYATIYRTNAMLQGLDASTGVTPDLKKQLRGEALFIRALCYFYLVNLYGDVPLLLSTGYEENALKSRDAVSIIMQQVKTDLLEAETLLPAEYTGNGRTRLNRLAATAMLSRLNLYLGLWQEAEANATAVIENGMYSLAGDLNEVFLVGSSEAIWQLNLENTNTQEGFVFIPFFSFSTPALTLTNSLLNAFETGDQRRVAWTKTNVVGGQNLVYPFKYKVRNNTVSEEYNTPLRLAEQYLIRAEARVLQDNIPGAREDLDMIRTRAGLPGTTANDKAAMLVAIEQERRVELFGEWGHRWFDLKRTGRVDEVLVLEKPLDWQTSDALYPIPLPELLLNPRLTQNPGY